MPRFYFHVRSNGHLIKDEHGRSLDNHRAALCPRYHLLTKFLQPINTFVSTQICDAQYERKGHLGEMVGRLSWAETVPSQAPPSLTLSKKAPLGRG